MRGCAGAGALVPVSTAPRRLTRSRYSLEHSRVFHSGADAPNGRARREQARERRPVGQVGVGPMLERRGRPGSSMAWSGSAALGCAVPAVSTCSGPSDSLAL